MNRVTWFAYLASLRKHPFEEFLCILISRLGRCLEAFARGGQSMYEGEPDPTGRGLLYSTPSRSPTSVPAQGKYHKTHHNMVDYYVPHTLLYLCTKSLHHITHTTTWWVTVSHTLCTAYHIPLYHITYYEVLQYSTTLYHTQHHIPTLYIPLYPCPCTSPLYHNQNQMYYKHTSNISECTIL